MTTRRFVITTLAVVVALTYRFLWARALTLDLRDITTIRARDAMIPVLTAHGVRVEQSP